MDKSFNVSLNIAHSTVDSDALKSGGHLQSILEGNMKWVEERRAADPTFFDKLAKPQTPKYLYFGCADSRVPANEILGKGYAFDSLYLHTCKFLPWC